MKKQCVPAAASGLLVVNATRHIPDVPFRRVFQANR
jgi:hypothetical protein